MLNYLIMCRSLTYAQRAVRELERSGITGVITKAPQSITDMGCAYCIKVSENRLMVSLQVLRQAGIDRGRVFQMEPNGSCREVAL